MAGIIYDKQRVLSAIDAVAEQTMNMDMPWDWPCGVAYFGMCEASRVTGDDKYIEMVKARVDEYIELSELFKAADCYQGVMRALLK